LNVHEYQAEALLRQYGVDVPAGKLAHTAEEGERAARALGGTLVVKAQVHAGGRGKGGGIKVVKTAEDAGRVTGEMIGMTLVTPQTGAAGKLVSKVYIEEATHIERELYLALLVDRATQNLALVGSTEGGMEIEEVAARTPEKILTVQVDPLVGICDFQARDLAVELGVSGAQVAAFVMLVIESMADGAVRAGLSRATALELAAHTVRGAAALLIETGKHPGELKDMVTSPGGTTIAGIEALEAAGLRSAVIAGITAAAKRSRKLSQG